MPEIPEDVCEKMAKEFARGLMDVFITPTWIPTSERLPDPWVLVNVCYRFKDEPRGVATACVDGWGNWRGPEDQMFVGDVTHWMPLPEPPNDVAEQT